MNVILRTQDSILYKYKHNKSFINIIVKLKITHLDVAIHVHVHVDDYSMPSSTY